MPLLYDNLQFPPVIVQWSTQSNPTSGVDTTHPSGNSVFTCTRPGMYKFTGIISTVHQNVLTASRCRWTISTTGIALLSTLFEGPTFVPNSENETRVTIGYYSLVSSQTLTCVPIYSCTYTISGHDFRFSHIIERVGD